VNSAPLDVFKVGADKMPAEAAEWRFSMRRDIIVTLMQLENDVKQPLSGGISKYKRNNIDSSPQNKMMPMSPFIGFKNSEEEDQGVEYE